MIINIWLIVVRIEKKMRNLHLNNRERDKEGVLIVPILTCK